MISFLIPVYNEETLLENTVSTVSEYAERCGLDYEIIVVDNGSTDATLPIGEDLAAKHDFFRIFHLDERSVGKAFVLGVESANGEIVISLDADLSSDLTFIDYVSELDLHFDMLVGSKTMGNQRRTVTRIVGSFLYIFFTQVVFDMSISDFSLGAKAYRREAILEALPHLDDWTGYVFELCLFLNLRAKRVIQVGINCEDTRKSRFNLLHEGLYRYAHLYRCWRRVRDKQSWFHTA